MSDFAEFLVRGVIIGAGGAALMDLWALVARHQFNIQGLDYALLGRWIGHFQRGQFLHERIASSDAIRGERPLGWAAHYAIGITFAYLLLLIWGLDWARSPTLWPAMLIGLGTIVAPWFVLQPGMGAGIAAARTPNPGAARFRNLAPHTVYGVGLFVSALALSWLWVPQKVM